MTFQSANGRSRVLQLLRLQLLQGDSSNVSKEDLHYQLPAQVGSFAPILGEVQSAYKAVKSYFYFDFDFSEETLVTSPRRIFTITFQPR